MTRRISGVALLTVALALGVPSIASADTTIGSTTQPSGSGSTTSGGPSQTYMQNSSLSFLTAVPAGGGRITSWSTNTTGATPGATVQLVVLRPAGVGSYTVIAVDSETLPNPLPASHIATFTLTPAIAVNAGDKIGINTPLSTSVVYWQGGSTPASDVGSAGSPASPSPPAPGQTVSGFSGAPNVRVNVSAVVSPTDDAAVKTSTAPARPSVGNPALLASTVSNNSPSSAGITFTDTVPSGLTINSAVAGNGSCSVGGQTVTCTINLGGGSSAPVNVLVTAKASGSYLNRVSVAPIASTDPNPANNSATATLRVFNTAPSACTVPKLRGTRPVRVAKRVLKVLGCKVKVQRKRGKGVPHGAVLKTKPKAGTYKLGRKITLIVRK